MIGKIFQLDTEYLGNKGRSKEPLNQLMCGMLSNFSPCHKFVPFRSDFVNPFPKANEAPSDIYLKKFGGRKNCVMLNPVG